MADWEIQKTLGSCFGSGREFAEDEEYFAALVEGEEGFERRDYCSEYWEENRPEVYCFWKTRLVSRGKKKLFVDDEMLFSFFNRLEEETDEEKVNFRFVLTLILMRKKKLKYDSMREENGVEKWRLRVAGGDKQYVEVVNPHLDEASIESLSSQVGQILQADL